MADQDQDGPSLELPSLGLGRKRKRKKSRGSAEPTESSTPQPDPEPTPDPASAPEPVPEPEPTQTAPSPEPARPLFADEPTDANQPIETTALPATGHEATTSEELHDEPAAVAGDRRKERRGFSLPSIGGMPSAIITGALVGALTVALTWGALRGCEAIKGTSSCGGPGLLLLVAIMVAMIFLGSLLLRGFGVPDPGSTSFLAVGLLAVIALLFLVDALFNWWMVIIIPVLAILTFALSHWVTVAFIEPSEH